MKIEPYQDPYFDGVDKLWQQVFPDDPPHNRAAVAIPKMLAADTEGILVALAGQRVIGTVTVGYDGHRGWLYTVAVHPDFRRTGVGSALVQAGEQKLTSLGCLKVNLQVRAGNETTISFYEALGYGVEPRISMGKRLDTTPALVISGTHVER
ncbi:MAG: GNAT family acetyltransferase [Magnetospiraceae bacterium]